MIDYNKLYKFISDGTWFDEGTECLVVDGNILCDLDDSTGTKELSYDDITNNKDRIIGLFSGIRTAGQVGEMGKLGERYEDEEMCGLDEFEVIKL